MAVSSSSLSELLPGCLSIVSSAVPYLTFLPPDLQANSHSASVGSRPPAQAAGHLALDDVALLGVDVALDALGQPTHRRIVQGATTVAETIRVAVEEHAFPHAGRVTISLGVAVYQVDEAPASLIERADRAAESHGAASDGVTHIPCADHAERDSRRLPAGELAPSPSPEEAPPAPSVPSTVGVARRRPTAETAAWASARSGEAPPAIAAE